MDDKIIALTFDDGPNTVITPQVLDIIERYGIPASFFLIGQNISEKTTPVMKRALSLGCEINHHSFTHPGMPALTKEQILEEMRLTTEAIEKYAGVTPKFFRPPYIAVNDLMYECIELPFICGYGCDDWDAAVDVPTRVKVMTEGAKDGSVMLLHDMEGNVNTVAALPEIIENLTALGFRFVTVSHLFADKGITPQRNCIYTNVFEPMKL